MLRHFRGNTGDSRWRKNHKQSTEVGLFPSATDPGSVSYLWELAVWHSRPRSHRRRSSLLCCSVWWWRSEPEDWHGSLKNKKSESLNLFFLFQHSFLWGCGRKGQLHTTVKPYNLFKKTLKEVSWWNMMIRLITWSFLSFTDFPISEVPHETHSYLEYSGFYHFWRHLE